MAWNEERATKRVDENDFSTMEVKVADLTRDLEFANLGRKEVRRANAAHIYADVSNFHLAVRDAGGDKQKQCRLIRAASVLRRVQSELLKSPDIVGDHKIGRIQLQAARLHALCYKPYPDEAVRAKLAVVMGITLNTYLYDVFNPAFEIANFRGAVGIDAGRSLITNPGYRDERERICLGTPANRAARVLGNHGTITVTEAAYRDLPKSLQAHFEKDVQKAGTTTYIARGLKWTDNPELAQELGVEWKAEKWAKRTEELKESLPLSSMTVAEAEVLIDVEELTERNSRRTRGIPLYADLDGFTRYVQEAEKDDAVVTLVRELHMIRHEFHAVLKNDFPGIVLQHQGDRTFSLLHMPCGAEDEDAQKRCRTAVNAAIGLQSSMTHVLSKKLAPGRKLSVAIGLDAGRNIVSRLGAKGKRTVVCFGPAVTGAEDRQLAAAGGEIRISETIYKHLEDGVLKDQFTKDGDSYVATDLTFPKLNRLEEEAAAKAGALSAAIEGDRVKPVFSPGAQTKPWMRGR